MDSTEEDEAALEEETSEEERNVNLDESDTDEETLRSANYSSDGVKEKWVVMKMKVNVVLLTWSVIYGGNKRPYPLNAILFLCFNFTHLSALSQI